MMEEIGMDELPPRPPSTELAEEAKEDDDRISYSTSSASGSSDSPGRKPPTTASDSSDTESWTILDEEEADKDKAVQGAQHVEEKVSVVAPASEDVSGGGADPPQPTTACRESDSDIETLETAAGGMSMRKLLASLSGFPYRGQGKT